MNVPLDARLVISRKRERARETLFSGVISWLVASKRFDFNFRVVTVRSYLTFTALQESSLR